MDTCPNLTGSLVCTHHQIVYTNRAFDSWSIAGLTCHVLTSAVSPQCRRTGFCFPVQSGRESLHLPTVIGVRLLAEL